MLNKMHTHMSQRRSLLLLVIGATLFAGVALADLAIGSGYQQLKSNLYTTSHTLAQRTNYTATLGAKVTLDGVLLAEISGLYAFDLASGLVYEGTTAWYNNIFGAQPYGSRSHNLINLTQKERLQWREEALTPAAEQSYYLWKDTGLTANLRIIDEGILNREQVTDLERIFDAVVGNLASLVQVSSSGDGKEYSLQIDELQVPLLVQALTSYIGKELSGGYDYADDPLDWEPYNEESLKALDRRHLLPLTNGASLTLVRGEATSDSAGSITSGYLEFTISGRDARGEEHVITAVMQGAISEVGSTALTWPELAEQQVTVYYPYGQAVYNEDYIMQDREAGRYVADIVLDTGEAYLKIGERTLLLEVTPEKVTGYYGEEFYSEYRDYDPYRVGFLTFELSNRWPTPDDEDYMFPMYLSSILPVSGGRYHTFLPRGQSTVNVLDESGIAREVYLNLRSSATYIDFSVSGQEDAEEQGIYRASLQRFFE
ncbi:MAG: hypothetical protein FWF06_01525 [Symbiobacteriaceae bacterium]|nr:hypothetical protein [Symbiobacteriaceae bacterium]